MFPWCVCSLVGGVVLTQDTRNDVLINVHLAGTTVLVHLFASSSTQVDRIPLFRITPDREMRPADYQNGKFF